VIEHDEPRDLAALVVPLVGALAATDDPWEPFRLLDPAGRPVGSVSAFLKELQAAGRPVTTQRSYGTALLWFRFLSASQGCRSASSDRLWCQALTHLHEQESRAVRA